MVNALTEGLLVCDAQRRVTYANPSAARLLGVSLDTLVGLRLPEAVGAAIDEFDTPSATSTGRTAMCWPTAGPN